MVHNAQFWLMIVHEYLDDKTPMSKLCKKYSVDAGKIKYRISCSNGNVVYRSNGQYYSG